MTEDTLDTVVMQLNALAAMRGSRWTDEIRGMLATELVNHSDACGQSLVRRLKLVTTRPDIAHVDGMCSCPRPASKPPEVRGVTLREGGYAAYRAGYMADREKRGKPLPLSAIAQMERVERCLTSGMDVSIRDLLGPIADGGRYVQDGDPFALDDPFGDEAEVVA